MIKALERRRAKAKREKDEIQHLLDDIYRYMLPFRKSTKDTGRGETRIDQVFDSTAIDSGVRFAGKFQQDFWPSGQENFTIEPGPVVIDPGERDRLTRQVEPVARVVQAFFDDGAWDMAIHEMGLDLVAGTGAILMNGTADPDRLWDPICVPIDELLIEDGDKGGVFWDRKMTLRTLFETWPDGKFSQKLRDELARDSEKEIDVCLDTIWNQKAGRWIMSVWAKSFEEIVYESRSRTRPWLIARYFRLPGETWGRGVGHLALPDVKTTNTAKRLQLQAAAIAMLGIYTAVDDGVFNPDLAPAEPGAFWKVARNGGVLGPSVQRFPDPRLDLSNFVLKDLQMSVKATMMDQALPPDAAAVRSATEIMERVKRLAQDHIGAYGRLVQEVVVPAVRRGIELAYDRQLIPDAVPIDQLLFRVRVKSPIAMAREASRIERIMQWLETCLAVALQLAQLGDTTVIRDVVKVREVLADFGQSMNVKPEYIVSAEERAQNAQQDQANEEAALAAAAAMAAAGQGGEVPA